MGVSQMRVSAQPARREVTEPDSERPSEMPPQIVPTGTHGSRMSQDKPRDSMPSYVRPRTCATGQR